MLKRSPVSVKPVKRPDPGKKEQVGASIHNELEEWPRVLEYLQSSGKMKVYAYLIGTRCYLVDDSTAIVVVGCDEQLKKNILCRRESIEAVKEALNKVTGISLKVKVRDEAEMGLAAQDESGTDPVLEKVKRFAMDNGLKLDIKE